MKIFIRSIPLLLFIVVGIFGVFSKQFIQTNKMVLYLAIIPAFGLGIFYTFWLTPHYNKVKGGKVALTRFIITLLITAFTFRAMQGYIIYLNCYIGKQNDIQISGTITHTEFANNPILIFAKNSIKVVLRTDQEILNLEVPGKNYYIGQEFSKKMVLGSLGIIYSSK
jgi:hypothetical protein